MYAFASRHASLDEPFGPVPKSLFRPKAGAKHPESPPGLLPYGFWTGQVETNYSGQNFRSKLPDQKCFGKDPKQPRSGEPKHQTGFGQVKTKTQVKTSKPTTFSQNFRSKLRSKLFGTLFLYNCTKLVLDKLKQKLSVNTQVKTVGQNSFLCSGQKQALNIQRAPPGSFRTGFGQVGTNYSGQNFRSKLRSKLKDPNPIPSPIFGKLRSKLGSLNPFQRLLGLWEGPGILTSTKPLERLLGLGGAWEALEGPWVWEKGV